MSARYRIAAALTPALLLLAGPANALALNVNEDYRPQDEFKLDTWFSIGPINFNKAVMYVIIATLLTVGTMLYISRRMHQRPNRVQTAVEVLFTLMRDNITRGNMSDKMAARWFPFVGALFLFIWFSNMIGYLPLPTNTEHTVDILGLQVPSLALRRTANLSCRWPDARRVVQLSLRRRPHPRLHRLPEDLCRRRRRARDRPDLLIESSRTSSGSSRSAFVSSRTSWRAISSSCSWWRPVVLLNLAAVGSLVLVSSPARWPSRSSSSRWASSRPCRPSSSPP